MSSPAPAWVWPAVLRLVAAVLVLLCLGACSSGSPESPAAEPTRGATATTSRSAAPPEALCLRGVHHTPRSNIVVNRAVVAPLSKVKKWVLGTTPGIEWRTFSSSLVHAPLREPVGVCVFSKRDGTAFDPGGGERPARSVVEIVRPNGESTLFIIGTLRDNVDEVATAFD